MIRHIVTVMIANIGRWALPHRRARGGAAVEGSAPIWGEAAAGPAQAAVDAADEATIRRYLERRTHLRAGLRVNCGCCGIAQVVHPDRGMTHFALVCSGCHEQTPFTLREAL